MRGVRRRGCGFLFVGGRMLRRLQQRSRSAAAFNTRRCAEVSQSHLLIGWRCLRERLCSALSELQASGFHFPPAAEERGERGQLVRPTHAAHRSRADSPDSAQTFILLISARSSAAPHRSSLPDAKVSPGKDPRSVFFSEEDT